MQTIVATVDRNRWDTIEPAELTDEMEHAAPSQQWISAEDELPVTFQFRTRDGGVGIGQITALDRGGPEEHGTLKIRFKLLNVTLEKR